MTLDLQLTGRAGAVPELGQLTLDTVQNRHGPCSYRVAEHRVRLFKRWAKVPFEVTDGRALVLT
jgi:hypothetical protein